MKKRVLFVDDEANVLEALKRSLRCMRNEWEFLFASSGLEAFRILHGEAIDVVVCDMQMPEIDGLDLLTEAKRIAPSTVRIVLTGQPDPEDDARLTGLVHQYLNKPCSVEELRSALDRAGEMRDRMENPLLRELVCGQEAIPSLPQVYADLLAELQSPEPSMSRVADLVSSDVGMTCKLMQLVNSSYFGLRRRVDSPAHAVVMLGIERIRPLAFSACVFSRFADLRGLPVPVADLAENSLRVAAAARRLAIRERPGHKEIAQAASIAAVVRDVGTIILAMRLKDEYGSAFRAARQQKLPLADIERMRFGIDHAEVGGTLLRLWNVSGPITDAVTFHHHPGRSLSRKFDAIAAVHIADALVPTEDEETEPHLERLDARYIEGLDLEDHVPAWLELVRGAEPLGMRI